MIKISFAIDAPLWVRFWVVFVPILSLTLLAAYFISPQLYEFWTPLNAIKIRRSLEILIFILWLLTNFAGVWAFIKSIETSSSIYAVLIGFLIAVVMLWPIRFGILLFITIPLLLLGLIHDS